MQEQTKLTDKTKSRINTLKVALGATLCCFLWGSATPSIKIGYELFNIDKSSVASIVLFAGIRFFIAGILTVIAGSCVQKKILLPRSGNAVLKVFILCLFQTVLQYIFFYLGLSNASGVKSSIIISTNVFTSLICSVLFFKQEKFSLLKVLGCIIGFAGVILVNIYGNGKLDISMSLQGEGFVFISCIMYGLSGCFVKEFSKKENTVMLSGWQFIIGGLILIIAGLISGGVLGTVSIKAFILLLYLSFISACAYTVWGLLLKKNDVSKVVVFGFLNPVFGVILSSIFLHESNQMGFITILSLILVSIGIISVNGAKN